MQLKSTEWDQYSEASSKDKYPVFQLGWFPDYPDADNYLTPFYRTDSFLNDHYKNDEMDPLLAAQQASTDQANRGGDLRADPEDRRQDVPIIPIWQGKQVAAVRDGVTGVAHTFDPSFQFRYWLIGRKRNRAPRDEQRPGRRRRAAVVGATTIHPDPDFERGAARIRAGTRKTSLTHLPADAAGAGAADGVDPAHDGLPADARGPGDPISAALGGALSRPSSSRSAARRPATTGR